MTTTSRWKQALALLSAGSQMIALGDNRAAYRRLAKQLDCLRREARVSATPCAPARIRFDWRDG